MPRILSLLLLIFALGFAAIDRAHAQSEMSADVNAQALPMLPNWTGDFDGMQKRRLIRILVPFSRTIYFLDKGAERGTAAEAGRELETWLNKKYKTGTLKIRVVFIPTQRDQLLKALNDGIGDIAAANLTITPERLELVDFTDPLLKNVKEIIVTGPNAPTLTSLDDLAGQEIDVRKSSSYYGHLQALNEQLKAKGLKEINIVPADEDLEDEDLLEMTNGGLLPISVVDDHKAKLWVQIFTKLKMHPDLAINSGGEIGWAVRKNSPLLLKELNEFNKTHGVNTSFGAEVMRKYYRSTKIIQNAYSKADQEEYLSLIVFFKKYATEYGFDYLMIAAQGFQESRLKQSTHSPMGAVGVMQLLPKTAADPKIAVKGIETDPEKNIEAGTKYLRFLTDTYLNDPNLDQKNKTLMAFAAYNAGPGNLKRFRKWAKDSGLDPNIWFNNVEAGAARIVGQETVTYVSNIYKYYVAYRLLTERAAAAEDSRKATTSGQGGG